MLLLLLAACCARSEAAVPVRASEVALGPAIAAAAALPGLGREELAEAVDDDEDEDEDVEGRLPPRGLVRAVEEVCPGRGQSCCDAACCLRRRLAPRGKEVCPAVMLPAADVVAWPAA